MNFIGNRHNRAMLQAIHDGLYDSCHLATKWENGGKSETDYGANSDAIGVCAINSIFVIMIYWSPLLILKYTLNAPTSAITAAMAFMRLPTVVCCSIAFAMQS